MKIKVQSGILALILILLALAPVTFSKYWVNILTEVLIMGLFAMAFNLLFGFSGLLSFGQAAPFGIGAYVTALLIQHKFGGLLVVIGLSTFIALLASIILGFLCVRRDEIFFAMLSLALGMMLYTIVHNWRDVTGGSDGLPVFGIPSLNLFGLSLNIKSYVNLYYLVFVIFLLGAFFIYVIIKSPHGLIMTSVRENKLRFTFLGGNVNNVRLFVFSIAGMISGLCGSLYCIFTRMASPEMLHWSFSAKPVLMTILGGSGTLFGPAVGSLIFFGLEQLITAYTTNWMIFLGAILVPVVLFFPKGVLGTFLDFFEGKKR